jgi:hypothetical protein
MAVMIKQAVRFGKENSYSAGRVEKNKQNSQRHNTCIAKELW